MAVLLLLLTFGQLTAAQQAPLEPWQRAGLSEIEAARRVLNRLAYGGRPGEAEEIAAQGVRRWIDGQLASGAEAHRWAPAALGDVPYLDWSTEDLLIEFGSRPMLRKQAIANGWVDGDDLSGANGTMRQRDAEATLESLAHARGMQNESEVSGRPVAILRQQRMVRGVASATQLHEILVDFWFNHFNVSANKQQVAPYLIAYERDAIRPWVLSSFADLLFATAGHPAMLHYLDNAVSRVDADRRSTLDHRLELDGLGPLSNPTLRASAARLLRWRDPNLPKLPTLATEAEVTAGLNENYARELLELHTVGVDGGYRPADVVDLARALTGWTSLPQHGPYRTRLLGLLDEPQLSEELGFVRQQEFLFRPDWHDAESKQVLGMVLEPGGGIEDADSVLSYLAQHPATARHVAFKLCQRFVTNPPPEAAVRRVANRYQATGGDLEQTMRALIDSDEFWQDHPVPLRKSPVEFVLTALRALDARPLPGLPERGLTVARSLTALGQPLYQYDVPTGFPPVDESWFEAAALLERANLALRIAYGQLPEFEIDLERLAGVRTFESPRAAMRRALDLVLPEREPETEERFVAALEAMREPRPRWFRSSLWLALASPDFQLR